jgi:hypothetical protein
MMSGASRSRAQRALAEALKTFEEEERRANSSDPLMDDDKEPEVVGCDSRVLVRVDTRPTTSTTTTTANDFYCTATIRSLYVRFCEDGEKRRFLADPNASARTARVFATVVLEEPPMQENGDGSHHKPGSPRRVPASPNDGPVVFEDVLIMSDILQQFDTTIKLPKIPRVISQSRCLQRWQAMLAGYSSSNTTNQTEPVTSTNSAYENVKVGVDDVSKYLHCDTDAGLHVVVPVDIVVALVEVERNRLQNLVWKDAGKKRDDYAPLPTQSKQNHHVDPSTTHASTATSQDDRYRQRPSSVVRNQQSRTSAQLRDDALRNIRDTRSSTPSRGVNDATGDTTTVIDSTPQTSTDIRRDAMARLEASRLRRLSDSGGAGSTAAAAAAASSARAHEEDLSVVGLSPIPTKARPSSRDDDGASDVSFTNVGLLGTPPPSSRRQQLLPARSRIKELMGHTSAIFDSGFNNANTANESTSTATNHHNVTTPSAIEDELPDARGVAPKPIPHRGQDHSSPSPTRGGEVPTDMEGIVGNDSRSSPRQLPDRRSVSGSSMKDQCTQWEPATTSSQIPRTTISQAATYRRAHHQTASASSRLVPSSRHTSAGAPSYSRESSAATAANRTSYSRHVSQQRCVSPAQHNRSFKPPGSGGKGGGTFADVRHMPTTPRRSVESPSRVMAALREQERSLRERQIEKSRQMEQQQDRSTVVVSSSARQGSMAAHPIGARAYYVRALPSDTHDTSPARIHSSSHTPQKQQPFQSYPQSYTSKKELAPTSRTSSPAPTPRVAPPAPRIASPLPQTPRPSSRPAPLMGRSIGKGG